MNTHGRLHVAHAYKHAHTHAQKHTHTSHDTFNFFVFYVQFQFQILCTLRLILMLISSRTGRQSAASCPSHFQFSGLVLNFVMFLKFFVPRAGRQSVVFCARYPQFPTKTRWTPGVHVCVCVSLCALGCVLMCSYTSMFKHNVCLHVAHVFAWFA